MLGQRQSHVLQPAAKDCAVIGHELKEDVADVVEGVGGEGRHSRMSEGIDESWAELGIDREDRAVDGPVAVRGAYGGGNDGGHGIAAGGEVRALLVGSAAVEEVEQVLHHRGVGVSVF